MKRRTIFITFVILVFVFGGPSSTAAKEIKVLSQFPMSGPVGSLPEFGWGYIDGMNWVNGEGGGVNGKKITWYLEDFRYNPTVEVANFNKYTAEHRKDEFLMATGYITGGLKPLIEKVNVEEKIPWLDGSYSTEIFGEDGGPSKYPYYYSLGATYGNQIKVLMKWIKENHKAEGKPRVGFVYSPTAWGKDGTPEGIAYAKQLGFDVVAEIEYPYTATTATNECMQLRKVKAQYVVYHGYSGAGAYTAIFFKTAKKILKGVQLMGTHYTTGRFPILVAQEAFDGYVGVATRPFNDAVPRSKTTMDNAFVKFAHDFAKKYRPAEYEKGLKAGGIKDMFLYEEGLTYALMIQKALTEADNKYELTREGVKKALDNMVWDFKGMFDGKAFAYKSHTIPMLRMFKAHVKMVKMGDKMVPTGGLTPIGDWINTDEIQW
ncbi:MAG: ABC transporter substrate-binding protein [Deltaproteobacteria bacterium]|nr:ABC transporter substrate-binding protein [Deltaproteobacteria bacterium]MBW2634457.1 ABC transporter substrate-binding protein [Deltaproteobacteria bacterium]